MKIGEGLGRRSGSEGVGRRQERVMQGEYIIRVYETVKKWLILKRDN